MALKLTRLWTGPIAHEERHPNPVFHWLIHPTKRHIARNYLKILQKFFKLKVIAIGGSNGKTTTRNMLLCILPKAVATRDSITSTYNIPSSILRLRPWTKFFICEMSVEYVGDMDFYLWLAKPDLAIITQIELEHTQFFGSLDNVAREENKLTRGKWLKIINGNSALINTNAINTFTFGSSDKFDCYIKSSELTKDFKTTIALTINDHSMTIVLPAIGVHLAHPLAAAVLSASKLNLDLRISNLEFFNPPPHRLNVINHKSGAIFIDDTYNSNPSSTKAAIATAVELAKLTKRKLIIVISQMNELGPFEISEHQKLKELVKNYQVLSIGPAAKNIGKNYPSQAELLTAIKKLALNSNHLILFKSSRSWKLESIIAQL